MVFSLRSILANLVKVLFSANHCLWKIGDFGLTTEGSSRRLIQTEQARGTMCYRAPELLNDPPVFSTKVDIFALGCILFELVSKGKKAFISDYYIHEYKSRKRLSIPFLGVNEEWKARFEYAIHIMLAVDGSDRPSANQLRNLFAQNRTVAAGDALLESKRHHCAIEAYISATTEGDVLPTVWRSLGTSYIEVGLYNEAAKAYKCAIDGGLCDESIWTDLGIAQQKSGDFPAAIQSFRAAKKKAPPKLRLMLLLAEAYMSNKEYTEAVAMFRKALKQSGNNALLLQKLACAHYMKGDLKNAFKVWPQLRAQHIERQQRISHPPVEQRIQHTQIREVREVSTRPPPRLLSIDTSNETLGNALSDVSADSRSSSPGFDFQSIELQEIELVRDEHTKKVIRRGMLVAALQSSPARRAQQSATEYGDLVMVVKLYNNGWALGIKQPNKVWGEANSRLSGQGTVDYSNALPEDSEDYSSPRRIFELKHFCVADMWEKV